MRIKIYVSDDGYGHVVRQRAIIHELLKKGHQVTIQTKEHIDVAKSFFKDQIKYIEKFNNIITVKSSGSLDVQATNELMENYFYRFMPAVIHEIKEMDQYDCVISDLVPEGIAAAKLSNKKAFAVCHHTWDWFFTKTFGRDTKFSRLIEAVLLEADAIFFPPFTPDETMEKYRDIGVQVPFITYPFEDVDASLPTDKVNVMIIDSGTKVFANIIEHNRENFKKLPEFNFVIIHDVNKIHNLIPKFDLVITRAGFNTISDCMVAGTPVLVINEKDNPEVAHNIARLSEFDLCGVMSTDDYANNFIRAFKDFMAKGYEGVKANVKKQIVKCDGAQRVVEEIIKRCTS
jgi:uncharacterized protein (TIGR00661 family)